MFWLRNKKNNFQLSLFCLCILVTYIANNMDSNQAAMVRVHSVLLHLNICSRCNKYTFSGQKKISTNRVKSIFNPLYTDNL